MKKFIVQRPIAAVLVAMLAGGLVVASIAIAVQLSTNHHVAQVTQNPQALSSPSPSPTRTPQPTATPTASAEPYDAAPTVVPAPAVGDCPATTVRANSTGQLISALGNAKPGDVISLGIGTFTGNFVAERSGTADKPIFLCGTANSILDGGDTSAGYVFHLDRASYWNLVGFSVTNGQKGVVADASVGSVIRNLQVYTIGDEAIHLRTFSTDNLVNHNTIHDTGLLKPKFGEGVYIGTAQKNWCSVSNCEPDKSDRNTISNNTIYATTAESIDIKEGTTSGIVTGNAFDGSKIDPAGASAWMNVKGNDWTISKNTGVNSPKDGFQTHEILKGWGTRNVFSDNSATVNGSGYGYALTPVLENVVTCSNVALSAGQGKTNVRCAAN